jgi:hypothetical protein
MHVRGIQHDAVNRLPRIRQVPAIHAPFQVGGEEMVLTLVDFAPENSLAIRHIGDRTSGGNIQGEYLRKQV